jgi:hypothetical protein
MLYARRLQGRLGVAVDGGIGVGWRTRTSIADISLRIAAPVRPSRVYA